MKKTCMNCKKYHTVLLGNDGLFHLHDWCEQWKTELDAYALAGKTDYNGPFNSDLETGEAFCYMYEAADTPSHPDEWFDKNRNENELSAKRSQKTEYILRKAQADDADAINSLFIEMLQTIYNTDDVKGYNDSDLDQYFTDGENWICVAESEEKIIAYLAIEVHREENDYLYYDDFCVSGDYRGMGIGTALINKAEDFCKRIGFDKTVLHVEKSNESAQRFYRNKGFEILSDDGSRLCLIKHL